MHHSEACQGIRPVKTDDVEKDDGSVVLAGDEFEDAHGVEANGKCSDCERD